MKIIVGLGNPGKKFENTRHNVGFMLVDKIAEELTEKSDWKESKKGKLKYIWAKIKNEDVELVKPQTFMNSSGLATVHIKKKHPNFNTSDFIVIHDDLDIPLGEYKIQFGKGAAGHKGVESIIDHLKTKEFWRVRVGINNRIKSLKGEDYVLEKFGKEEKKVLDKAIRKVIEEIIK